MAVYKPRGEVPLFRDSSCTSAHHREGLAEGKSTPRPFPKTAAVVQELFPHKLGAELREGRRGGGAPLAPARIPRRARGSGEGGRGPPVILTPFYSCPFSICRDSPASPAVPHPRHPVRMEGPREGSGSCNPRGARGRRRGSPRSSPPVRSPQPPRAG